ncbi:hypothetical protein BG32_13810 [Mesotoga sp. HF07.pep.5.2.highcov]|nr:hypothetical protein BG32_13810 [Mesotoga sp. HF07.pep.5.2.highcov]
MNKTGSPIQGFTVTEEVISISAFGSPLLCHPELVSGSGFDPLGGGPLTNNAVFISVQRVLSTVQQRFRRTGS